MNGPRTVDTVADIFRPDPRAAQQVALYFAEQRWCHADLATASAQRANFLLANRRPGPFHVGVLLDNVPEYLFWIGACALAGATFVALNPTRRGSDLARDVVHTDCQLLVTEARHRGELGAVSGLNERIHEIEDPRLGARLAGCGTHAPDVSIAPEDRCFLTFTSGTSGAPKAVIYSHGRVMRNSRMLVERQGLTPDDVGYVAMPLFHSTGLLMGLLPPLIARGGVVLRPRFSASGFLPDVRRYGVTRFCYVGKPLAYILATPERPDDADNPLRSAFGSEAADLDIEVFSRRFGCDVFDSYGSSEGCITILRTPETPRGSLGVAVVASIRVMNPETGLECPRARFDAHGVLQNGSEAIGELVNLEGGTLFEGYWNNPEAHDHRIRGGAYWSGDLGYRDEKGYFYFAGRDSEWLRVDGENLSATQIEQVLVRHPAVSVAAAYGVPDPIVGDQLMVALETVPGAEFEAEDLHRFLASQEDLGSKGQPSLVRLCERLPVTSTNKVLKRELQRSGWRCADPVWWRPDREARYRPFTDEDMNRLEHAFTARGRAHLLPVATGD